MGVLICRFLPTWKHLVINSACVSFVSIHIKCIYRKKQFRNDYKKTQPKTTTWKNCGIDDSTIRMREQKNNAIDYHSSQIYKTWTFPLSNTLIWFKNREQRSPRSLIDKNISAKKVFRKNRLILLIFNGCQCKTVIRTLNNVFIGISTGISKLNPYSILIYSHMYIDILYICYFTEFNLAKILSEDSVIKIFSFIYLHIRYRLGWSILIVVEDVF